LLVRIGLQAAITGVAGFVSLANKILSLEKLVLRDNLCVVFLLQELEKELIGLAIYAKKVYQMLQFQESTIAKTTMQDAATTVV
jgi:hypothetical protein